ncbi:hypothetical protein [Pilimelia terevasa]|nr:hypothetical protein [Pilimelia terevasa]
MAARDLGQRIRDIASELRLAADGLDIEAATIADIAAGNHDAEYASVANAVIQRLCNLMPNLGLGRLATHAATADVGRATGE